MVVPEVGGTDFRPSSSSRGLPQPDFGSVSDPGSLSWVEAGIPESWSPGPPRPSSLISGSVRDPSELQSGGESGNPISGFSRIPGASRHPAPLSTSTSSHRIGSVQEVPSSSDSNLLTHDHTNQSDPSHAKSASRPRLMLDLCSGTGSVGDVFEQHGFTVITVDREEKFQPTIVTDIFVGLSKGVCP